MKTLRLSSDLTLPIDAVTQAIGILAKRRAGKSYLARRLAEQLFKAGQQIVIVDPKGDWWGIRSSADGKSPGLPVVILGGERGDVPLEVNAGEIVAKLVTEERVSVLLDLSLFRKHEVTTFMTAFLENLYRLKAKEIYRTPLMLFIDEADAIAPQKPQDNQARMLGAAEDIVRRGGQRGIGCTLITQRSAVLNKNVLTQVEMMVALRTIAPQDLKAMDAWIEVHGEKEQRDTLMASLPALPDGDAWFWSPGWPTRDGLFKRTHVAKIETFDSGATPKSGEKRVEPKNLADVDLDSLTRQMAATIEKAKADDPKELKKQIAERDRRIRQLEAVKPGERVVTKPVVDQAAIDRAVDRALSNMRTRVKGEVTYVRRSLVTVVSSAQSIVDALTPAIGRIDAVLAGTNGNALVPTASAGARPAERTASASSAQSDGETPRRAARSAEPRQSAVRSEGPLPSAAQRILDAIAFYNGIGQDEPLRQNVAGFAGMNPAISTWRNALTPLRAQGLISERGEIIQLTDAGSTMARHDEPPSLEQLHNRIFGKLPGTSRAILKELIAEFPESLERSEIGDRINVDTTLSTWRNALTPLRRLGVIDEEGTQLEASQLLFPEGLS